jgi:hypothetical protein
MRGNAGVAEIDDLKVAGGRLVAEGGEDDTCAKWASNRTRSKGERTDAWVHEEAGQSATRRPLVRLASSITHPSRASRMRVGRQRAGHGRSRPRARPCPRPRRTFASAAARRSISARIRRRERQAWPAGIGGYHRTSVSARGGRRRSALGSAAFEAQQGRTSFVMSSRTLGLSGMSM